MLIYLNDDILRKFKENNYTEEELDCLESIISSHIQSKHFVFATRKGISFLANFSETSRTARKSMKILEIKYPTIHSFLQSLKVKIMVINGVNIFEREENENSTIFKVSLDYFKTSNVLENVKLISENIEDSYFYKEYLNYYKKNIPLGICSVAVEETEGNGHGITKNSLKKIQRGNMILIITDSDKKHPTATLGNTSRTLKREYEKFKDYSISDLIILDVHEKENLIPYKMYYIHNTMHKTLKKIEHIEKNIDPNFSCYFDFKLGLNSDNFNAYHDEILTSISIIEEEPTKDRDLFYGDLKSFKKYIDDRKADPKNIPKKFILKPVNVEIFDSFSFKANKKLVANRLEGCLKSSASQEHVTMWKSLSDILDDPISHLNEIQKKCVIEVSDSIIQWGLCKNATATGA